ncbi:hypothetical protein BP6252_13197 [Coleophoma cylindrospora]|uniref:Uncharacterized protein n=1 Tax=Coleophoma cylindrospora TaxID=1849047 RepID=A0A3D8QAC6_9HELO|nr:hypothetical protein BP6252_13197 [Coleophoma cylindrospora]
MDSVHGFLTPLVDLSVAAKIILTLAILFLFTNLKSLPFVWHVRCFNGVIKHLYCSPHNWEKDSRGSAALFQPLITSTYTPFMECDFNGHKSSSTYFTDIDVSRLHLVACLFNKGIKTLQSKPIIDPRGNQVNGQFSFVLGGVECTYRREIKPLEKYEIWTRVLAWDRKWLYIVSHFVKKGAIKPAGYTLSDGNWLGTASQNKSNAIQKTWERKDPITSGKEMPQQSGTTNENPAPIINKAIYASAISKYVFKKGRLTLHPEICLEASGLLPARPGGWATISGPAPAAQVSEVDFVGDDATWSWQKVEEENMAGLRLAENFAALDGLSEVFTGSDRQALGVYSDLII